jgi:hypothetical protein
VRVANSFSRRAGKVYRRSWNAIQPWAAASPPSGLPIPSNDTFNLILKTVVNLTKTI